MRNPYINKFTPVVLTGVYNKNNKTFAYPRSRYYNTVNVTLIIVWDLNIYMHDYKL